MKVENVVLRKRSDRIETNGIDSDADDDMIASNYDDLEEDQVAISSRWRYQRKSQTWSRIVGDDLYVTHNGLPVNSTEASFMNVVEQNMWMKREVNGTKLIESQWRSNRRLSQENSVPHSDLIHKYDDRVPHVEASEEDKRNKNSRGLQRSQSERIKERARALMKRMDIRSSSRRRKREAAAASSNNTHDLVIGSPVLMSHYSASPSTMRMYPDNNLIRQHIACGGGSLMQNDGPCLSDDRFTTSRGNYETKLPGKFGIRNTKSNNMNKKRMGMVILSPTTDSSSTEETFRNARFRLNGRRPRDMSCDPAMIRGGYSRREIDSTSARIYDRVALDDAVFPVPRVSRRPDALPDYEDVDLRTTCAPSFMSNQCEGTSLPISTKNGTTATKTPTTTTANILSVNRNGGIRTVSLIPSNAVESEQSVQCFRTSSDRRLNTIGSSTDPPSTIYNLSDRCRLVVNADGYYQHISEIGSSSPEATVNRQHNLKPGHQSLCSLQRAASPASSSSTLSTSNIVNRLKVDVDIQGKRVVSSVSPASTVLANSAQRSHSSLESNDEEGRQGMSATGERRDSGVGSSLSRSPSGPTTQRQRNSVLTLRNNSNNNNNILTLDCRQKALISSTTSAVGSVVDDSETFFCDVDLPHCMDALGVAEMQRLRKMAFLKLSVLIERYAGNGVHVGTGGTSSGGAHVKNWAMQKLMRHIRSPDHKPIKAEVSIFGLPLTIVQSRTGFALPRSILEVLRFLRTIAPDTVGIFRKNGVRSRIAELRAMCDVCPDEEVFVDGKGLDPSQVHDIADMLKQYFRELPEPLMTAKYSDAFANIQMYLPLELRLEALQYAVLLLPDENREALQTLLCFLHDVAKHSSTNNMNAQNLAVCFAPSLFHLSASRLNTISPTRRHKTVGAAGMPTEREMKESRAAQECLVQMINESTKIFMVPPNQIIEHEQPVSNGYEPDAPYLTEIGVSDEGNYKTYLLQKARELLKEHRDRWKGWIVDGTVDGVEISSKKSPDGHPLRYFRVWVDVEAPPKEILMRLIRERNIWDPHTINWRTIASLSSENCDVFQYVINDTPSHPTRDAMVVRLWRTDMKELRGGCVLIERSVHSSETQLLGGIPAAVLASRFLVEPNAGRSRVTYVSRIDLRGRSNIWYGKVYGHLVARQMSLLRDSFKQVNQDDDGPETKV